MKRIRDRVSTHRPECPKNANTEAMSTHSVRLGLWVTHRTDLDQITSYDRGRREGNRRRRTGRRRRTDLIQYE